MDRTKETTLFEYAERAADKAIKQAAKGAGDEGITKAVKAVLQISEVREEVTTDDVRSRVGDFGFREPRAWGVVMREAKKTGMIVPTDRYRKTGNVGNHNLPMRVWRRAVELS